MAEKLNGSSFIFNVLIPIFHYNIIRIFGKALTPLYVNLIKIHTWVYINGYSVNSIESKFSSMSTSPSTLFPLHFFYNVARESILGGVGFLTFLCVVFFCLFALFSCFFFLNFIIYENIYGTKNGDSSSSSECMTLNWPIWTEY